MSPRSKSFKTGSIIYFEGDKAENIYLLKDGKINLIYNDLTNGEEVIDPILKGEFFGVKSGLIHLLREETAKVVSDSVIFEFSAMEFESLISKNTAIILKMLKVFSNQLRKIGKQIRNYIGNDLSTSDSSDNFFLIGDYYLKNKKYKAAITVYQRYKNYYSNGKYAALVNSRLQISQNALNAYGEGGGPALNLTGVEETNKVNAPPLSKEESTEIDENSELETTNMSDLLDDSNDEENDGQKKYYKAVSLMGQNKFVEAYKIFNEVLKSEVKEEEKIHANFEMGKCLFNLEKYSDCAKQLTLFLSKYSGFPEKNEALFYIGSSYGKIGDKEKAEKILKNILSNSKEEDKIHRKALKALKEIG